MPQPESGPATREAVKAILKIADAADDGEIDDIVASVNAVVRRLPVSQLGDDVVEWPADVTRGANMLAARLFRRKGSPSGIEAFGTNGPVYVQRTDPDIAMLLQLGDWAPPGVA